MVGGELTGRSDIYALGVVIYEMISGRTPYADAQSATAILAAVLTQTPEPLSNHAPIPPLLDHIVARCLERDAVNRFGDVRELAAALAEVAGYGAHAMETRTTEYPVVPATGFETSLTTEATRIDVRASGSSQPVLDARGPRQRQGDAFAMTQPAPPRFGAPGFTVEATPPQFPADATRAQFPSDAAPSAFGSQHALDTRTLQGAHGGRGSQPTIPTGWPPPVPHAAPVSVSAPLAPQLMPPKPPLAQMAPMAHVAPTAHVAPPMPPMALGYPAPAAQPIGQGHAMAPMAHHGLPVAPAHSGYAAPSYDMAAAANHDALVRRIIWIALFLVAIIVVVLATR
jgi:serine/threonine-protein kinase